MADLTRRSVLGVTGLAALGTGLSWDRLTGRDVPGRDGDALTVAILGTAADAESRQALLDAFRETHPDIPVRLQAVQGQDWTQFFTKILTMVAAGTPPDVCLIATEGAQLFADRLAHPLDEFVTRDAAELQDYFDDVHPSLVESFMYQGSLFMLPADFNAANVYYNAGALQRAGLDRPADDWTVDDFVTVARTMRQGAGGSSFRPYFWTNRLWGGVVPWLYVHGTSFLRESRAGGGDWFWRKFYAGDPTAATRSGGYQWLEAGADDPAVLETFEFLREITAEGLGSSPAQGGGNELVARFAEGVIGMTPAGGFWAQGLADGGMGPDDFDVTFFPRARTQRHQFGSAGYAVMRTSRRKDEAWEWIKFCSSRRGMRLSFPEPTTTPARRSLVDDAFYAGTGPKHWSVFYDTLDRFPDTGPIPAPPQQAAVETALVKNVLAAVTAPAGGGVRDALGTMQRDLERALRNGSVN
ncbi:ABC transporter substrate-binding protein [Kineococcus rhizosphaerae]|uniref:Carbohydrate ABC transporter substrate-binding protein (CUT1 family) n=1 Tax=Kineococcus rhizosphaerae TaxID=559628 RepID=A0A2T0R7V2_9ACTN|nr:sugar ABC transporter substrate-binding protein [Kineococcus rhizosphaerae]PRY17253.1 carbohydrate ABC transporter substrate-binding protein (CUT1 family) [Kineococcus rhizosphaerae]